MADGDLVEEVGMRLCSRRELLLCKLLLALDPIGIAPLSWTSVFCLTLVTPVHSNPLALRVCFERALVQSLELIHSAELAHLRSPLHLLLPLVRIRSQCSGQAYRELAAAAP